MKKLVLLFAVVAGALMTGCDGFCTNDFVIINQTESEIIVDMSWYNNKAITINKGNEQAVHHEGHMCSPRGGAGKYNDDVKMIYANMQVGKTIIPDIIWTARYWNYESSGKFHSTYTLVVTEELLESLKQTN